MHRTILVIDDVEFIAKSIAQLLRKDHFEVLTAQSGAETRAIVQNRRLDLVVTDMVLPDEQGATLIAHLRALSLPVIAMTGGGADHREDIPREALAAGAVAVLLKPVSRAELLKAVDQALGSIANSPERVG
jgi:two-component system response regulator HydG